MSLSNILVNDISAPFKDVYCRTLTCQNIVQGANGGAPLSWASVISNQINVAGAPTVAYTQYDRMGNVVSGTIGVSGLTNNAIDTQSSFIFTLPVDAEHVALEVMLVGTGRIFEFPEVNLTVVNSGLTPNRCTVNYKSIAGMLGAPVSFLIQFNYVAVPL
jgi:hypothetical protein